MDYHVGTVAVTTLIAHNFCKLLVTEDRFFPFFCEKNLWTLHMQDAVAVQQCFIICSTIVYQYISYKLVEHEYVMTQ